MPVAANRPSQSYLERGIRDCKLARCDGRAPALRTITTPHQPLCVRRRGTSQRTGLGSYFWAPRPLRHPASPAQICLADAGDGRGVPTGAAVHAYTHELHRARLHRPQRESEQRLAGPPARRPGCHGGWRHAAAARASRTGERHGGGHRCRRRRPWRSGDSRGRVWARRRTRGETPASNPVKPRCERCC